MASEFAVDVEASRVLIRTRAKGFLSALAHDLELSAKITRGTASKEGDAWEAELAVDPSAIRVVGAIKSGKVSPLTKIEVDMCEKRIVTEVFAGAKEIVVRARGTLASPVVEVTALKTTSPKLKLAQNGDAIEARGPISIQGLGLPEVKAPLNAFTLRDDVEIEAHVVLAAR